MPGGNNPAQVVIRRRRVDKGSLLHWPIRLDGKEVGSLPVYAAATIPVSKGKHSITIRQPRGKDSEPFLFHSKAGQRIELTAQATGKSGQIQIERAAKSLTATESKVATRERSYEPMGSDKQTFDNSRGLSSTKTSVSFTKAWTKTYTLDVDQTVVTDGEINIAPHFLTIKARAERTLKQAYTVTETEQEEITRDVEFEIPAQTKSEFTFFWRQVHEEGVVQLSGDDFIVEIPYKAAVGLIFNWTREDTPYEPGD